VRDTKLAKRVDAVKPFKAAQSGHRTKAAKSGFFLKERFGDVSTIEHKTGMRILCDVNRAECLRYGIDAPSSMVDIEVNPKLLTQDQRNFIVANLYERIRFPKDQEFSICPPTYNGLIASVNYGLQGEQEKGVRRIRGGSINLEPGRIETLAEIRRKVITAAIAEDVKEQKLIGLTSFNDHGSSEKRGRESYLS
jgi:hypothetical protein